MTRMRTEAEKLVETIAGERCPCGHLRQRHRRAKDGAFQGMEGMVEVMGKCRDCNCSGICEFIDEEPTS